jgi:hypothetical protein
MMQLRITKPISILHLSKPESSTDFVLHSVPGINFRLLQRTLGNPVLVSPAVAAATAKIWLLSSFDVRTSIRAKENEISQLQDNPTGGANEVYIFSLVAAGGVLNLRSSYFPIRSLRELLFVSEMQCPIATPHFEDFISQVSNNTDYINEASSWLCNSGKKTLGSQQRKGSARS